MHIVVNGVRLFFDVAGEKLVPDDLRMRERAGYGSKFRLC